MGEKVYLRLSIQETVTLGIVTCCSCGTIQGKFSVHVGHKEVSKHSTPLPKYLGKDCVVDLLFVVWREASA